MPRPASTRRGLLSGWAITSTCSRDQTFWETIGRTLYFTVVSVGLELVLGLAIAQLIHSHPWGWKFLRFSLIIPWAVPTIVNGAMWRWIYSADFGALNGIFMQLGLIKHYIPWLTLPNMAMNLVILADVWHMMPFVALILQAALATLPEELDEAAAVDGANALQRFWYIRLPLLRPAILVALIVRTVDAFRVFDIAYIITSGGPAFKTVTITYLTYLNTFSYGKQGTGAALSFLISIFTIIMAFILYPFPVPAGGDAMMHTPQIPQQAIVVPADHPGAAFYLLPDPLAVQRQPFHPGGAVRRAAALDPAASHPSELPGYLLPQPGGLLRPAHLCRLPVNSFKIASAVTDHLHRHGQPGRLCAGAHPLQIQPAPSRSASWARA